MAVIGNGPLVTNFGAPRGGADVTAIGVESNQSLAGSPLSFTLYAGSVAVSQTDLVQDEWKAPFKGRFKSISHSNLDATATASFDLYNLTQTEDIIADQTLTADAEAIVSTFTNTDFEEGDVIQLRATTDGTGDITDLTVVPLVQVLEPGDGVIELS